MDTILERPDLAIPDYQTLMLPVLRLASEQECTVPGIAERIASEFGLSPEEKDHMLPSGRQRLLHNRIHWAKTYMSKAGLLVSPARGRFVATKAGLALVRSHPPKIDVSLLLQIPSFKDYYRRLYTEKGSEDPPAAVTDAHVEQTAPNTITPEEQIEAAYQSVQATLRSDLLERILQNSPSFFETAIVDLLVAMGYGGSHKNAAMQLGRSGDGGVDGIVNEDRLGLDRVYVQAKRYAEGNSVGRPDVQAFVGSLVGLGATKGVFVTTSTFSTQARAFAKHLSQRIILMDGQMLADLMIEHGVGVRTSRAIQFKRVDEDFFTEDGE
jgi:restriction system protein